MDKKPKLLTNFATLLLICMATLFIYIWINYEDLRSEQSYRQIWYLNHKSQNK